MRGKSITALFGVAAVLLICATGALAALPAFTTAPKTASPRGDAAEMYGVTAACHPTYDRFVIKARFATPGYDVRYVPRIVADPSGNPVQLLGAKRIRVSFNLAAGHDNRGRNLLTNTLTPRCPNLLQVKKTGDFEGTVTFGLGVCRMTGFRVFRLTNPPRTVIDVAH